MSVPAIDIDGLTKFYGDVRGVEDLSLSVPEGELFGFLGPNGAGKSTTIRLLLGLLKPTDGTASILGTPVDDRAGFLNVLEHVGHIPSDPQFYDEVSGRKTLDYFARLSGDTRRDKLLDRFPVPLDRPVRAYSRGNRQKLAIVQAFMHEPRMVIMDEPTAGLDPLVQQEFYDFLHEERSRGVTVFFSTHILSEVRQVCDQVAIIREGKLAAVEHIDDLLERSGKVVTLQSTEPIDLTDFEFDETIDARLEPDGSLRLVISGNYDALVDALDDYRVDDLEVRETAIEDVFMHFYDTEEDSEAGGDTAPEESGAGPDA
ncbi:ABC transporter ATP-binding protein [Haloferax mediterranei ATCC 33500]|uniref:ABC transporter n=1 Tax=Haloferax mediterranei (strain ATCC 33500 / DSM 1411 / JCM 8866 / NBRC 14739 / NCIMB 2177 / R-4) TaxID=523841 RepID=I3R1I7_HALMT|nr:ABC transporter ATP-binding protein [Haloferax mediterranei]AFK18097.1 ABC transporter ATP-binding protein [Haloferax mediterranei ATCC 33500]AHZ22495.1 ABC transporter [Haloferax mediterranei ATCC 33500]EMA02630.1 ABC transporter ATP-binding protein [Haloferax mediterranei ATCC 33500]MDX5988187.1 ABC transporter ATP-binding protein [Haloferax mediterranei ATCC 33500]QCQ74632.1 ABC transporter ATP-binding protein [Haloferax mediterranei ATCC 33500]